MSEPIHDRVTELLDKAAAAVDSIPERDHGEEDEREDQLSDDTQQALEETNLFETAGEANTLFETENARDILEALDLAELPDGSEPAAIPEAIAKGDEDDVEALRVLLKLAKFSSVDGDTDATGDALEEIRGAVDSWGGKEVGGGDSADADDGDDDSESSDEDEESITETVGEAVDDATDAVSGNEGDEDQADDGESEGEGEDEGSIAETVGDAVDDATDAVSSDDSVEDRLEAAVQSAMDGFDDEIRDVRDRLAGVGADDDPDDEPAQREDEDGETADDAETTADDRDDDSLLGDAESPDAGAESEKGKGKGTMYSTMAPPPSNRADMRKPTRHSTMPDRK